MYRPLTDTEKIKILKDGISEYFKEVERKRALLQDMARTAAVVNRALIMAPTWDIVEAPMPSSMTEPPVEGWTQKVEITKK